MITAEDLTAPQFEVNADLATPAPLEPIRFPTPADSTLFWFKFWTTVFNLNRRAPAEADPTA